MFVDVIEQSAQAREIWLTSSWVQDNSRNERLMLLLPHRDILKRTRMINTKQRYVIHGGGSGSISGVASMLSSGTENSEYEFSIAYWAGDWKLERCFGVSGNWNVPTWNDGIDISRTGAEGIELGYKSMWILAALTAELWMILDEFILAGFDEWKTLEIFV